MFLTLSGGRGCSRVVEEITNNLLLIVTSLFLQINSAFNGKRKMLRNTLQHMFSPSSTQAALLSVGLPETVRMWIMNRIRGNKLMDVLVGGVVRKSNVSALGLVLTRNC